MNSRSTAAVRAPKLAIALSTVVLAVALAGCSEDNPTSPPQNQNPTSTTYTGSVTSNQAAGNGTLTITVQTGTPAPNRPGASATATVAATGVFTPSGGGTAIALAGTYDLDAKTFTITDGTWTFDGGLTTFGVEGSVTGPGGVTGSFSLFVGTSSVIVVVGTYAGTTSGNFNFGINGSELHGNAYQSGGGSAIPLDGTYNASSKQIVIYRPGETAPPYLAVGTYDPANNPDASGTWDNQQPDPYHESGTWSGNKQ
jgi:hypothetical protein